MAFSRCAVPPRLRLVLDTRVRVWESGRVVGGGSPWRLSRLASPAADLVWALAESGTAGVRLSPGQAAAAAALVQRGVAHPIPALRVGPHRVEVVVPAFGRTAHLVRTLTALRGLRVTVVDDGSPDPAEVEAVAKAAGASLVRLAVNRGPASARNAGLASASAPLVALVDSDCVPEPGWLDRLVSHFDDQRVAAVAPRVLPDPADRSLIARYERAASALDMGRHAALVRPGARVGFVPSATLLVRRDVVAAAGFDEAMRLGEDVDLVWRLADMGWLVRYEPRAVVWHVPPQSWVLWFRRRFEYGTSATGLEVRHPGRLAPLHVSPWNAAALALVAAGRPELATGTASLAVYLLMRRLGRAGIGKSPAVHLVCMGLVADAVAAGHALRREYWPLGAAALIASPWSRTARLAVAAAVSPIVAEWLRERPALDLLRYSGLRLAGDAAYGTGVLAACARDRTLAPIRPRLVRSRGHSQA